MNQTKFTRGPVTPRIEYYHGSKEPMGLPSIYSSGAGLHVCKLLNCNGAIESNGELIAAAFNSATECEDAGFDGIAAVRALPQLLQELRSAFLLAHPCPDCGTIELLDSGFARCSCCDAPWDWNQVAQVRPVWANARATLATARGES